MKTCLFVCFFSFHLLFTVWVLCKVLFYTVSISTTLSTQDCKMSGEKQCPSALSTKDARAIRKFSGMLKRMHMHTMP